MKMRETSRGRDKELFVNNNVFLNPDRVSLPDIDTDFSKHARAVTIKHVTELYGQSVKIQTKITLGGKSAMDYASKLYALETDQVKGFYSELVKELKSAYDLAYENAKDQKHFTLATWKPDFVTQFGNNMNAIKILDEAILIEGMMTSTGVHAAGQVMANDRIENYIPLAKDVDDDGEEVWIIQADMTECEGNLGFIKMDFLGLKNLNIITDCQRLMTRFNPAYDPARGGKFLNSYSLIDLDKLDPRVFAEIYAKGDTNFVFQFESPGMKKMLVAFKPTCLEDIILLVAAYRPGPMQFIPAMTESKNTGKKSELVTAIPQLEPILSETYGYPIYQEQIMKICTDLAGYTMAQADNVRKYMSKKKTDLLKKEKEAFVYGDADRKDAKGNPAPIAGCVANGIDAKAAEMLWEKLEDFGKYAFNKAHATAYAVVSYITAWLKLYFFREYICAAITTQSDKKEQLSMDCHARNIRIYPPDINTSECNYTLFKDGIMPGISSIKGIDKIAESILVERSSNGPFASIYDIIDRCKIDKDILETLIKSGACDSLLVAFNGNRDDATATAITYLTTLGTLQSAQDKLKEWQEKQVVDVKEQRAQAKHVKEYSDRCASIETDLEQIRNTTSTREMNGIRRLSYESDLIGMWVTGNPMDEYRLEAGKYKTVEEIATMDEKARVMIAGFVTGVKKFYTKKDGHAMCAFTLIDKNGARIKGVAFPTSYEQFGSLIRNNTVVEISGSVLFDEKKSKDQETDEDTVPEEKIRQISVGCVEKLIENKQSLFIDAYSMEQLADEILPILNACVHKNGVAVRLHERTTNSIYQFAPTIDPEKCEKLLSEKFIDHCVA